MVEAAEFDCLLGLEHGPPALSLLQGFCFPTPSLPKLDCIRIHSVDLEFDLELSPPE